MPIAKILCSQHCSGCPAPSKDDTPHQFHPKKSGLSIEKPLQTITTDSPFHELSAYEVKLSLYALKNFTVWLKTLTLWSKPQLLAARSDIAASCTEVAAITLDDRALLTFNTYFASKPNVGEIQLIMFGYINF